VALEVLQCCGRVGERRPPRHRAAECRVICGRQRDTPLAREPPVHLGEQLRVAHGRGRGLLRRLVLRELRQRLLAPGRGIHCTQQRLQGGVQAALPVDQSAVAVEGEYLEVGQFPGAHAAALAVSIPASRRRLRRLLGGTGESEDSFPRTEGTPPSEQDQPSRVNVPVMRVTTPAADPTPYMQLVYTARAAERPTR